MDTSQDTNPWLEAARCLPTPKISETKHCAPQAQLLDDAVQVDPDAVIEAEQPRAVLVAAHGGAGTTTWSHILGAVDGGTVEHWVSEREPVDVPAVLVLRASVEGISTAKSILALHGAEAFVAALVVAASPGKLPRRITSELRILGGAINLIHAPWVPDLLLKRAAHATSSDLPAKELTKLTTMLTNEGIHTQGETT
nr:hypothetical protein pA40H1_p47 [Arthrobacter sp.]